MRTIPSKHIETNKSGRKTVYEYAYHSCPRHAAGACGNGHYFREDKLRKAVIGQLRAKLFPTNSDGTLPAWLPSFVAQVEADIAGREERKPDKTAARTARIALLEKQQKGWTLSLGDPELPLSTRKILAESLATAVVETIDIRADAASEAALASVKDRLFNPAIVVAALRHLDTVLAAENPTLGNLELSRHIERIDCHADGRIVLRGTMLGVLGEGTILLTRSEVVEEICELDDARPKIVPRRRSRLFVPNLSAHDGQEIDQSALLDPTRFEGFGRAFFWDEEIFIKKETHWYQDNAPAVASARLAGKTHEKLAEQFGVSVPTIRKALLYAESTDGELAKMPRKMKAGRWQDANYQEVAQCRAKGESVASMARSFSVSEPLIRDALKIAATREAVEPAQESGGDTV